MSLVLKRFPVTAVEYIKFSGEPDTDYYIQHDEGIIARYCAFPRGYNVIEIKYTA